MSLGHQEENGSLRILEVVGVLLAVIPCGVLAGLYLVSEDITFLIACAVFAAIAVVVVFWRRPGHTRRGRRGRSMRDADVSILSDAEQGPRGGGLARFLQTAAAMRGKLTKRLLKVAGFLVWMAAWIFTAVLFTRVAENENVAGLAIFVMIGSLSPLVFYLLLETGVSRLSSRLRDED